MRPPFPFSSPARGVFGLLAVAVTAIASPLANPLGAQDDRQRVDTTFAFASDGSVELGLVSGEIRVVGARTNEVRITASIERGRLETSFSRSRVSIEARSVNNRMGSARYDLTVPVGTRVRANSVSGDITVRATMQEVTVRSVSGDITVEEADERVDVATVSGDVDVSRVRARTRAESVSGDIIASELRGSLAAESVSGTIDLRRSRLDGLQASSVSGDIRYEGPFAASGTYRFNSHSGIIGFGLPANAGATLELETFSGRITSDFPLTMQPGATGGRRDRRMDFTIGSGGARISAETFSGNITIRRLPASGNED
jgi:DUF4097 and DUF4098 domain-containing protein YvlB